MTLKNSLVVICSKLSKHLNKVKQFLCHEKINNTVTYFFAMGVKKNNKKTIQNKL